MAVSSYNPYDAVQGFRQVKVAQFVSIALAAVLAFGLAAALGQGIAPLSRVSASIVVGKRFKPRAVERTSRGSLSCSCRAEANQQAMLPETSHLHIVSNKFQDLELASQLCVISHSRGTVPMAVMMSTERSGMQAWRHAVQQCWYCRGLPKDLWLLSGIMP